ncbi:MAG: hypothetical protein ACREBH_01715 [Candidatus Micrarchaeaceae archaeon]
MDRAGIPRFMVDGGKSESNLLELRKNLDASQLLYVEVSSVDDICGCHGMGVPSGHKYEVSYRYYLGVYANAVKQQETKGLSLFEDGEFVRLDRGYGSSRFEWEMTRTGGLFINKAELGITSLVRFGDEKDLGMKKMRGHSFMRVEGPPRLSAVRIFLGDSNVLCNYVVDDIGAFDARSAFKRLGVDGGSYLDDRTKDESEKEIAELYSITMKAEKKGAWDCDELAAQARLLREREVYKYVTSIKLHQGITLDVEAFLKGVEKKIAESGRRRSTDTCR